MGVGAVARKFRLIDEFSVRGMVNVLVLLVTPALIITLFQRPFDVGMLRQFALAFAIAIAVHLVLIALAEFFFRCDAHRATVLKLATVFSNAGFMGIPLEQAVLGDLGAFYGVVYIATFNLFMWSYGYGVMKSGSRLALKRTMFVNPGTVAILVALPLFLTSTQLPFLVREPVRLLSLLNTPLAMVVIGFYLAGANLKAVFADRAALLATLLRLVVSPLLVIAALWPLAAVLDGTMALAMVTASSVPVAAMTTMFAAKYARDVELSVGLVSSTTLLSMLTIPATLVIAFAVFS